ncbi:MAG: T9SS type A sorting domain-containing protein [Flavobacterium sp. JAD_PAG50586_2]|nr:MAG: T9SS type A sorting domain-containing protein [Flavobacterium sp. JAD_PAG50586_2]
MKNPLPLQLVLSCFFITCTISLVHSQDILWEKSYGGKHGDYLFDAIPTPDYGFILAGSSLSKKSGNKTEDNRGDLDYWVWKMDEKGELDWQKTFGSSGQDKLRSVLLTNDGGYLLAGSCESKMLPKKDTQEKEFIDGDKKSPSRGGADFWVIKLNAKGGEEWQKTLGGKGQDELNCVVKTKDGGFILGGSSSSDTAGEKSEDSFGGMDYWVIKLDREGKIVWQHTLGGRFNDELRSITTTEDGGFLLGGSSNSPDTGTKTEKNIGQSDYWIVKLDNDGNERWQKTIGGSGDDQLYALHTLADGNYMLAGSSNSESGDDKRSANESGSDFWILKIDKETKEILWQETYNIAKADILTSLVENDDTTILLGGYAQGEVIKKKEASGKMEDAKGDVKMKSGTDDYVAIKINAKGEELWRRNVGSDGQDILQKVIETRDGGYLMAGTSKTLLNVDGGVKASGDKSSGKGNADFWVVKLKDKKKPKKDKKPIEAIPNPAMDYTNVIVGYDFTKGTATLVDIAGHLLQTFKITERTVPIDLQGLPEGVYIVNIKTDKGNDGVKIIKQRNKN